MTIAECNYPVSDNIIAIISERGLKQCAVAEKAGYSAQVLNDMLNGRRIIRTVDILNVSKALGITPNDLCRTSQGKADKAG